MGCGGEDEVGSLPWIAKEFFDDSVVDSKPVMYENHGGTWGQTRGEFMESVKCGVCTGGNEERVDGVFVLRVSFSFETRCSVEGKRIFDAEGIGAVGGMLCFVIEEDDGMSCWSGSAEMVRDEGPNTPHSSYVEAH
jgi:hypothetical protein